jgi:hypothetical protein
MVLCYMPLSYDGANGIHYGWLNYEVDYQGRPNGLAWRAHSPHAYAHRMEDEVHTGTKGSKVTHWMALPKSPIDVLLAAKLFQQFDDEVIL